MDADTLAAVRAALARDREAEGAMTPGEWAIGRTDTTTEAVGEDGEFVPVHYVYRPGRIASGSGGEWEPRIPVYGDDCLPDAAGIARARNRWRLYLALAEAVVAERQAEREAEDYANACEGGFDPIALRQPINVARAATDAALAALAEPGQEPTP